MPNDIAQSSFTIAAKTRSFQLDPQGKGTCSFTVANAGKAALEGRVRLTPTGQNPAAAEWLTLVEPPEQLYKPNEEHTYTVNIAIPADAAGGTYLFRAEAYSVANPNDDYISGPEFSLGVLREGPTPNKKFPLWIPFTGLALLIAVAALVAVLVMGGAPADGGPTKVPELVGRDEAEAIKSLIEARLVVSAIERRPSDQGVGKVIGQDPPAGGEIPSGSGINLVVAAAAEAPTAPVPDLTGKTLAEARRALAEAKLTTGVVGDDPDAAGAEGSVVRQAPAAGTKVGLESAVSLVVKSKAAPTGPGPIAWQGNFSVRQTWFGDVDMAKECDAASRKDADFWFHAVTATERYLDAQNGAQFGFPSAPTMAACSETIKLAPVTRIPLGSIKPDKLIAVRTNLGRYALLTLAREVGASPATLQLKYLRFSIRLVPIRPMQEIQIQPIRPLPIKALPIKPVSEVQPAPATLDRVDVVRPAASTTLSKPVIRREVVTEEKSLPNKRIEAIK
jgi:hypothetical protein